MSKRTFGCVVVLFRITSFVVVVTQGSFGGYIDYRVDDFRLRWDRIEP